MLKIEKADAGWRVITDDETYYVGEYDIRGCNEGVIYRDKKAFNSGVGVCYVPEYGFDNDDQNAGELFEFAAKQAVSEELQDNPYVTTSGYTREDFDKLVEGTKYSAYDLFMSCEWQHPETLLDEWTDLDEEEDETDSIGNYK